MGFHRTPTPSLDPPEPRIHPDDVMGRCPHCEELVADAHVRVKVGDEWFHADCYRQEIDDATD